MPDPKFPDNPFWDFSLAVYGQAGVAPACLRLQERHAADVNILLFICWWCGGGRGRLDRAAFELIAGAVGEWHETYVRSLRGLRTQLKNELGESKTNLLPEFAEVLRGQIKGSELFAEQTEQLMLHRLAEALPAGKGREPAADARESAKFYVATLGGEWSAEDQNDFAELISAAGNIQ